MVRLKGKRELHRQWKQGQVPWIKYRDAARLCREGESGGPGCSWSRIWQGMQGITRRASTGMSARKGRFK